MNNKYTNWDELCDLIIHFGGEYNIDADESDENHYFICPECGEPIYNGDFAESDFLNNNNLCCPVCGTTTADMFGG